MATINFFHHPNDTTPLQVTIGAGDEEAFFYKFYTPTYITSISSITALSLNGTDLNIGNGANVRWFWHNGISGYTYSTSTAATDANGLKNLFTVNKQIVIARYGYDNNSSRSHTSTISGATITIDGNVHALAPVSSGSYITKNNMDLLKDYLEKISTAQGTGSGININTINQYDPILDTNWDAYINKANSLVFVSGLNKPNDGATATAAYYNSIVNTVKQI